MADTVRQKERKLGREKIKDSINRWIAQVPDLSTPHYEKDDDLMPSQAYDEIRELAASPRPGFDRDLQFCENWEIDLRLSYLITLTEQHIHIKITSSTNPGVAKKITFCQKLRNVIETNLPFTVYCRIAQSSVVNGSCPYPCSYGMIYKESKVLPYQGIGVFIPEGNYVPPKEQNKLLAIIINQQSKIDRLENMLSDMANCTKANELRQQSEINRLESVLSDMANCTKANELRQQSEINRLESVLCDMDSRFQIIESTQVFRGGWLRAFLLFLLGILFLFLFLLVGHEEDTSQVQVDNLIDLPKNPFDDL